MIKKLNVAGIELDNYTVRESIMLVEKRLTDACFFTMEEVNMEMLLEAQKDPVLREALVTMSHTIISENGILEATDTSTMQRKHEIKDHVFYYEFLKRVERNQKTVFLLGETQELCQKTRERMEEDFPRLIFAGQAATQDCVGALDAIVNEINSSTPDIIISVLPSPQQEYFLQENKDKLSANVWYGMGNHLKLMGKKHKLRDFLHGRSDKRKLAKQIDKYDREAEAAEEAEKENQIEEEKLN